MNQGAGAVQCCIAGGGPAGMMLGLLLARAGVTVLVLENLALRHQLAVLQRSAPRPRLRPSDRVLWVLLSRLWRGWGEAGEDQGEHGGQHRSGWPEGQS